MPSKAFDILCSVAMGGDSGAANLEGASCDEAEGKAAEGEHETPGDCPEEVRSELERISTT